MRHFLCSLLLTCAGAVSAQVEMPGSLPVDGSNPQVLHAAAAWLVGDHVKARQHFRYAAQRGNPLGQYNLAMMLLHGEGGPCGAAEATAMLRKAAEGGVGLAREAMQQVQDRGPQRQPSRTDFPCALQSPARSTPVVGTVQSAGTLSSKLYSPQ